MVVQQRQTWQLPLRADREAAASQLAQICQLPKSLDFPRRKLPACLHYIGQLQNPDPPAAENTNDFPWHQLTGQRIIYASLGTLQNRNWHIFESIAAACVDLDAQLVVAMGNPHQDINQVKLAGKPIVVAYAPQKQIIDRATLVITHAGLNTTLEALSAGVPMVAIPITNDQPGVAARIVRSGAGLLITLPKVTTDQLKSAITTVLNDPSYTNNALKMQADIQAAGGVQRAADIVEQVIATGKPLIAN
jgi:zeaxanthin glucosyltransferase